MLQEGPKKENSFSSLGEASKSKKTEETKDHEKGNPLEKVFSNQEKTKGTKEEDGLLGPNNGEKIKQDGQKKEDSFSSLGQAQKNKITQETKDQDQGKTMVKDLTNQEKSEGPLEEDGLLRRKKKCDISKKSYEKVHGKRELTLLEAAKEYLKANELDFGKLKDWERWKELKPEDIQKLKRSIADKKRSLESKKAEKAGDKIGIDSNLNISEELLKSINEQQLAYNQTLLNVLQASQDVKKLVVQMSSLHRHSHLSVLSFLKSLEKAPLPHFFAVIIGLIKQADIDKEQTELLVALCGIYNGEIIDFEDLGGKIYCATLTFLAKEERVTTQQIIGFLKFIYVGNYDIHNTNLEDMVAFDTRCELEIRNFKYWLQYSMAREPALVSVLPNSCRLLGVPFVKQLQKDQNALTYQVPPDFQGLLIQILVFSFAKEKKELDAFRVVAQNGLMTLLSKIYSILLFNLFSCLATEVREFNPHWYQNIQNSTTLLEGALNLVKESKIDRFDIATCKDLLLNPSNIQKYFSKPSLLLTIAHNEEESLYKQVVQLNSANSKASKFLRAFSQLKLLEGYDSIFSSLQIKPHSIQKLALKILAQQGDNTHIFFTIAPGLGKTKLILAEAIDYVSKRKDKRQVFIMNSNPTLLYRDFQAAAIPLEERDITYSYGEAQCNAKIVFIEPQCFLKWNLTPGQKFHVIVDEYQNIFFKDTILELISQIQLAESFTGYSGSPLIAPHMKIIRYSFQKEIMPLILQLTPYNNFEENPAKVCSSLTEHIKEIRKAVVDNNKNSPVIIILTEKIAKALKKTKNNLNLINLIGQSQEYIKAVLENTFNKKDLGDSYGSYIINIEMGTGTDFLTSKDIQDAGGLLLVVGVMPETAGEFEQLSSRVGRIFNKGRRSYIIQDSKQLGYDKDYLRTQLSMIQQRELMAANKLLGKIKIANSFEDGEEDDNQNAQQETKDKQSMGDIQNKGGVIEKKVVEEEKDVKAQSKDSESKHSVEQDQVMSEREEVKDLAETNMKENASDNGFASAKQPTIRVQMIVEQKPLKIIQKEGSTIAQEQASAKDDKIGSFGALLKEKLQEVKAVQDNEIEVSQNKRSQKHQEKAKTNLQNLDGNVIQKRVKTKPNTEEEKKVESLLRKRQFTKRQQAQIDGPQAKDIFEEIEAEFYGSYSKKAIHKEMTNDKVRCAKYKEAIEGAGLEGKTVLDLGSGSGILSVHAVNAGAAKVIAIDKAFTNHLQSQDFKQMVEEGRITYINDTIENVNVELIRQVDCIISEWMGYFCVYENMIGSYIKAIKRFLKPKGIMIPSKARMYLEVAALDPLKLTKTYLKNEVNEVKIACCKQEQILNERITINSIDFTQEEIKNPLDNGISYQFEIKITQEGLFNAFVGSFDTLLGNEVSLDTMPNSAETHWKQSLFFIKVPIKVIAGDKIIGSIKIDIANPNHRNLIVQFNYEVEGKEASQAQECFSFV